MSSAGFSGFRKGYYGFAIPIRRCPADYAHDHSPRRASSPIFILILCWSSSAAVRSAPLSAMRSHRFPRLAAPYRHVCGQHAGLLLLCRVDRLLGRRFPVRRTFQRTCQSRTRHGRMRWFVYDVDTRAGRFYRNPRRSGGGRHCLSTGDVRAGSGLCVCRRVGRNASGRLLERIRRSVR